MVKTETVLIIHQHPKILLGMKKVRFGKGKYNGFGGRVENGETLEECAIRETYEETGLKVNVVNKGPVIEVKVPGGIHQINYFLAKADNSKVLLNSEHSEYKWVIPIDALNYEFGISNDDVKRVLEKFSLL